MTNPETTNPEAHETPEPATPGDLKPAASRTNGSKSRGPVTPEGKARCAKPSPGLRHELLARAVVLPNESLKRFRLLCRDLEAEFQPATPNECRIVEGLVACTWRRDRAWSIEKALITRELHRQTAANPELDSEDPATRTSISLRHLADHSASLSLINRSEMRFERQYQRLIATLIASRQERRRAEKEFLATQVAA